MVKIKKNGGKYFLYVDNILFENIEVTKYDSMQQFSIETHTFDDSLIIFDYEWKDFPGLDGISMKLLNVGQFNVRLLAEREIPGRGNLSATFSFEAPLTEWKGNYSFKEYIKEYESIWLQNSHFDGDLQFFEDDVVQYEITFLIPFGRIKIRELVSQYQNLLVEIHEVVDALITAKNYESIFLGNFNFPEQFKIPCKQYLLYFAQFLQDLGINATSNLTEEAGKVLFSVTPTDDQEALGKIREALAVYLNLPSSPIVYDESFAAMRLQQQVENLQHAQRMTEREIRSAERELRLSQTVIEHQDKAIQDRNMTIEQQNRIIEKITDKAIMINSAENKEELEEVFEGLKVGKSKFMTEQIGVHLNPVTAIKTIGRKLTGGDDEIISLKINE
jgi:hypothetical protein